MWNTTTWRIDAWFGMKLMPQQITLEKVEEEQADDVARAIYRAGARIVDVYAICDGQESLTGFFCDTKICNV